MIDCEAVRCVASAWAGEGPLCVIVTALTTLALAAAWLSALIWRTGTRVASPLTSDSPLHEHSPWGEIRG